MVQVRLVKDKDKKENKGFAFIVFTTKDAAQMAVEEIQDKVFKVVFCEVSRVPSSYIQDFILFLLFL